MPLVYRMFEEDGKTYYSFPDEPFKDISGNRCGTVYHTPIQVVEPEKFLSDLMEEGALKIAQTPSEVRATEFYKMLHKGMYHICRFDYDVEVDEMVIDYLNFLRPQIESR